MKTSNTIVLLGHYGGDEHHCLSAWQSTSSDIMDSLSESGEVDAHQLFEKLSMKKRNNPESLLRMLAENGHHTPFEKSVLHFQLQADVATHIQCLKHRIAVSINTESANYKAASDAFYIPDDMPEEWQSLLEQHTRDGQRLYKDCLEALTPTLGRKRAKGAARYFLGYNNSIAYDAMFNFRSFMHFVGLRNSDHAQQEIRLIAQEMLQLVKAIPGNPFELSLAAFGF